MEETFVKTYKNLNYILGGDLVKCNYCGTLMYVPFACGVCPECGETHYLEDVEQDANFSHIQYEYAVIETYADYGESDEIDDEGYIVAKVLDH